MAGKIFKGQFPKPQPRAPQSIWHWLWQKVVLWLRRLTMGNMERPHAT